MLFLTTDFGLLENMPNSTAMLRLLCVNCNICINKLRRHRVLELETRAISVICEWISPIIIEEEDYICNACWELALRTVNINLENEAGSSSSRCHNKVCMLCGRSLVNQQRDAIVRENPTDLQQAIRTEVENRIAPRQVAASDCVCHPCWLRLKRAVLRVQNPEPHYSTEPQLPPEVMEPQHPPEVMEPQHPPELMEPQQPQSPPVANPQDDCEELEEPGSIQLRQYRRSANTSSHCIFHECYNVDLHRISDSLRATILCNHNYYVAIAARVCGEHLLFNNWEMLFDSNNSLHTFTTEQVEHVFSFVNKFNTFLDFSSLQTVQQIDDHLFKYWLGRSKQDFFILINEVPLVMETYRGLLGLGALSIKMRTGDSDDRLSQLLQTPRRTLERLMNKIREILVQYFVPRNLGITHISRDQLITHNLLIPNSIFNENNANAIVICDGTYIYINKSANYKFQKDTYSMHKYRNLLKPFLLLACDGYIVDCFGPYKATTSDADIMNSLFREENSPLRQYFLDNNIFILDRGFRDSIATLEACNYKAYMPDSLLEGEYQLTTQQANRSRSVTICRWVVEVVNGYLKRDYKIFRQDYFNKTVPYMMQNFSIAASLINRFGVRLKNRNDAQQIIRVMRERFDFNNNLSDLINDINMNRRTSNFRSITADRDNALYFPRLEFNELILFALGTYQIQQARSYYGEHVRFHGGYVIEVCRDNIDLSQYRLRGSGDNILIRGRIRSRHISRKQYFVYILVENNVSGREGIAEYCCNCLVGRRTIGCCAHVMTIVWYLGWARHQQHINAPAAFLDEVVIREEDVE